MDTDRIRNGLRFCIAPFLDIQQDFSCIASYSEEDWKGLYSFAEEHNIEPVLFEGFPKSLRKRMPSETWEAFEHKTIHKAVHFYTMLNFTGQISDLFGAEGIEFLILKGITLGYLYPKEEMRYFGDVDVYIPDTAQYNKACLLLEQKGWEQKAYNNEWHCAYAGIEIYSKKDCYLELHARIAEDVFGMDKGNRADVLYGNLAAISVPRDILGLKIAGLGRTDNAVYLLLHMAKHFRRGIGMRQLLDWLFFLKKEGGDIDRELFLKQLADLGILTFAVTATYTMVIHLGLKEEYYRLLFEGCSPPAPETVELFIRDIFTAGEFGRSEKARITRRQLKGSGFHRYWSELQVQTKMLYPRRSKNPLLLPFLWGLTVIRFIKVMVFERDTNIKETLRTYRRRETLQQYLNLFGKDTGEIREDGHG